MELISQLLCLKGKIQKKFLMITHAKRQRLFDVMVSFVFCLGPGYFLKPCAWHCDNYITTSLPLKCGVEKQKNHLPKRRKRLGTS